MDINKESASLGLILLSLCVVVESMGLCLFARTFPNQTKTELIKNRTVKEDKEIACSTTNLPTVADGSFECPTNPVVSKGEACTLTCTDGFYSADGSRTVCEPGTINGEGKWSNGNFECREITCLEGDLPQSSNGQLTCPTAPIREGGVCNLTCNDGFYPFPSNRAVCGFRNSHNGGEWIDAVSCRQIGCNEWNEWNGREYRCSNTGNTWEQSRQLCEDDYSHLVTIENEVENEFIHKMVVHCSGTWTWIGLNVIDTEGTWWWSDSTAAIYTNWREGQPDVRQAHDCGLMSTSDGKWHDWLCSDKLITICERDKAVK